MAIQETQQTAHQEYRTQVEENLDDAQNLMIETIGDYHEGDATAPDLTAAGQLLVEAQTVEEQSRAI